MEPQQKIFWIASYPKSGNTLARLVLQAAIQGNVDVNQLGDICPSWHGYVRYKMALYENISNSPLGVGEERKYWDHLQREFLLDDKFQPGHQKYKFLKIHHALLKVSGQLTINPELSGGILYFVRNPIDVAKSLSDFDGVTIRESAKNMVNSDFVAAGDRDQIRHGVELRSDWATHVTSWTEHSLPLPTLIIRYEDFMANPARTVEEILQITETVSLITASKIAELTSFSNIKNQEQQHGFNEAGLGPTFFARARVGSRASNFVKKLFLPKFGSIIDKYDYQAYFR